MTPLINFSEPYSILVALVLFILVLLLAKETKKSVFTGILLGIFLAIIVGHAIEFMMVQDQTGVITRSIGMDFIFVFLSFISYLWIDDVETKEKKKKSIDNSLDWFWKKV